MRRSARLARAAEEEAPRTPSPPPKRPKKLSIRERQRPEVAYELVNDVPVSTEEPNFDLLNDPLSYEASKSFAYALYVSRNNWLSGTMFETIWTRKPRGKKLEVGEVNARERMSRLCECTMIMGPHTFPAKLFIVKDEEEEKEESIKKEEDAKSATVESKPETQTAPAKEPSTAETQPKAPEAEGKSEAKVGEAGSAEPEKAETGKASSETKTDPPTEENKPKEAAPGPKPNQGVVQLLQQMAKENSRLDEVMKLVATKKASPEDMKLFYQYLEKAKAEVNKKNAPPPPVYTPRRINRSTSLAFELFENPQERYLLPKKAVVEVLPNNDILWSFLHIHRTNSGTEVWTPTTVVLQDIPARMIPTLDGCVEKYDKVVEHMKEAMARGERADDQYVWYQIDKGDLALIDEIKKTNPPLQHVLPAKRQPKPRATASASGGAHSTVAANNGASKDREGTAMTPKEKAPKPPRVRHTTYPAIPVSPVASQPSTIAPLPPKLKLPDLDSFFIPPGGLPPLPPSLANSFSFPPIPSGPTAPRAAPAAASSDEKTPTPKEEDK